MSRPIEFGHGTRACYYRGCRHPECVAANARYQRLRRGKLVEPCPSCGERFIHEHGVISHAGIMHPHQPDCSGGGHCVCDPPEAFRPETWPCKLCGGWSRHDDWCTA